MNRIKQLSLHEAQKIAAGEVVERPGNVVKELIENSIDAGAKHITIFLEDGGRKLIKIVDDGFGMSALDARMSIKQYATSKINSIEDLNSLNTYGFRGEALSSIAAVSKLKLITKESESSCGILLEIIGSQIIQEKEYACNTGTEIIIEDLFFNVPARKKFLKSKETEYRAISHIFFSFCFSYPTIYFKLYSENRLIYNCPQAENLTKRLEQLFEKNLTQEIILINGKEERLKLICEGIITDTPYSRYDRSHIFIFVNKRWVKNSKLSQALIKGYQNILQPNKYPAGFLFITIDKSFVDINIHPRKEEVQFLHPKLVENIIELAVKKALENKMMLKINSNLKPSFNKDLSLTHSSNDLIISPIKEYQDNLNTIIPNYSKNFDVKDSGLEKKYNNPDLKPFDKILNESFPFKSIENAYNKPVEFNNLIKPKDLSVDFRLVGQLNQTYILIENELGLVLIDQHAAHERIIYEKIKNQFNTIPTIKLIFPILIELTQLDIELILPYLEIFTIFGLIIEQISPTQLTITQIPAFLNNKPINDTITQIISLLHNQEENVEKIRNLIIEKIHAQLSCTAAIKAGENLSAESMNEIVTSIYKCENKLTCPHGRPTIWQMSLEEIKKKFKRDYR